MSLTVRKHETLPVRTDQDVARVRRVVREWAKEFGFSLILQTKLVTAASEIARNTARYGREGKALLEAVDNAVRFGLRLIFTDTGPGLKDVQLAMQKGYSTNKGLGLGLPGSKRLVDEFWIESQAGQGTRVCMIMWK